MKRRCSEGEVENCLENVRNVFLGGELYKSLINNAIFVFDGKSDSLYGLRFLFVSWLVGGV